MNNNHYPHPIIAREGWPFLTIAVVVAALATYCCGAWSFPLWIIALFVLQFFRDPPRVIPQAANAVLSPADGRIVVTGGVIGWDAQEKLQSDFIGQVRQALQNIKDILAEGGARPEHLVRLTWYVVDIEEYMGSLKELGKAYRDVLGAHYPAMALVQVVRLVERAARVEIEATAVVPR